MGKRIGIDLGTTDSCVCIVDDTGVVRIIEPSEGGGNSTPSVVYFDPESNEVVVGSAARQEGSIHPECMVECVKNYMGDPAYILNINGQDYSPAAITSLILRKLICDAEDYLGNEEIEGVVITCPTYFGEVAREELRRAAENIILKNGKTLTVLQILDEPVAAALAYANIRGEDMKKRVLVYDLGGATFDATVLDIEVVGENKNIKVITANGTNMLGGKDWDDALANCVRNMFCEETGVDVDEIRYDPEQICWFSENMEKAKRILSVKDRVILVPSYIGNKAKVEITREIFEEKTRGLLDRTIQFLDDMLSEQGIGMDEIDEILLVGGSALMPQVETRLQEKYGKPTISYDPDKMIAKGAAVCAAECVTSEESVSVRAKSSIGLKVFLDGEEKILNLIFRGEELPKQVRINDLVELSVGSDNGKVTSVEMLFVKNESCDVVCAYDAKISEVARVKLTSGVAISKNEAIAGVLCVSPSNNAQGGIDETATFTARIAEKRFAPIQLVWKKRAYLSPTFVPPVEEDFLQWFRLD